MPDSPRRPFRTFQPVIALVHRHTISRGDEGQVSRVLPDGRIEMEVVRSMPGLAGLPNMAPYKQAPFRRTVREIFAADELRRPDESVRDLA